MSLVLDSSVTLSWYFEDERSEASKAVLDEVAAHGAVAPSLWRLEVANSLAVAIRRKRITRDYREASLVDLATMAISIDPDTDRHAWSTTMHLADRHSLTMYDAVYLELAMRRRLPLATLEDALRTAARTCGLTLLGIAT